LNGNAIFNNGVDIPQAWVSFSTGAKLVNLPNWNTNTTARVVRSFKAYVVAGDITVSTTRYGNRFMWSGVASPGGLPATYDPTLITYDAGYFDLADTDGTIIDMKPLNDYLIVYKQNATYAITYVGGSNIFAYKKTFSNIGALSKNCITEVNGKHFVVTTDDVILTDGFTYTSIVTGRIKRAIFAAVNSSIMTRMFVVPNYRYNEVWICVPSASASKGCNLVYIYNYENNTWSTRTMSETPWISAGFLDIPSVGVYNSYTSTTYSNANFPYDSTKYNKTSYLLSRVDYDNSRIVLLDSTTQTDMGTPQQVILERKNIKISDDQSIKTIKSIWPKMTLYAGSVNSVVQFYIGTQLKKNDDITWQGPYNFDINTGNTVDLFATGRYMSLRISSNTDIAWSIENMDIDVFGNGKW